MSYRAITQKQRDLITDYLANHAEKIPLYPELIQAYRKSHKNRLKWGKRKWSVNDPKHKNNPFCNICDVDFNPYEIVYIFYVRALLIYHVECFYETGWRKQLSVIYQDRAYRKKQGI